MLGRSKVQFEGLPTSRLTSQHAFCETQCGKETLGELDLPLYRSNTKAFHDGQQKNVARYLS